MLQHTFAALLVAGCGGAPASSPDLLGVGVDAAVDGAADLAAPLDARAGVDLAAPPDGGRVACPAAAMPSGPITVDGKDGVVIENVHVTSQAGDCVTLTNVTHFTLRNSEIGPCAGNAIVIHGGATIDVVDSWIHPDAPDVGSCCDNHDGLYADGAADLTVEGNVITYGEANVELTNTTRARVAGNFLLNPRNSGDRGQNVQAWGGNTQVTVENNYALASTDTKKYAFAENQEDSINFGLTDGIVVTGNYVTGGHSDTGCGILLDDRANSAMVMGNTLVDTGACGIGVADGTNQVIAHNRVLNRTPTAGGGDTAIYVWSQYAAACGPVLLDGNVASEQKLDGTESGFWNGGGCEPVSEKNDTWDAAARALLMPVPPPPPIPPGPRACVAQSPWSG